MLVIICKYDKHLVTLYNVIFSNITGMLSHLYISSINTRWQQCATEMKCIGKPICLTKLIHKLLFLLKRRAKKSLSAKWDRYNMK